MKVPFLLLLSLSILSAVPPSGMAYIPGGSYKRGEERDLGSTAKYPEEKPAHEVTVSPFFIDLAEVSNADFQKFVVATKYRTQAERGLRKKDFPKAPEDQLRPGAMVFIPPAGAVEKWQLDSEWQWWQFVPGANWQHPQGPSSDIKDKMDHPVVCLTKEDAEAYCEWAGKRLPTEAEWECAARGGRNHTIFTWGDHPKPFPDRWPANTFQGLFPHKNSALDGFAGTAPIKSYDANDYELYDMAGNVWEICSDLYRPDYYAEFSQNPSKNPKGPAPEHAISQLENHTYTRTGRVPAIAPFHPLSRLWVIKGGSYLCHDSYCLRYRPAARHYTESLTPTNHTGFRCAMDIPDPQPSPTPVP